MRRTAVVVLGVVGLLVAFGGFDPDPIVAQVGSMNGPDGASYEFEVDGFPYALSAVTVGTPGGDQIALA